MVQPIDYLGGMPQVDLGQSLLSGLKAGAAIRGIRDERAEREKAANLEQQFRSDLENAFANGGNAKVWAELGVKYPQLREASKQYWDITSEEQRNAEFGAGTKVYGALQSGRPEFAKQIINENITAMKNSGQDASELEGFLAEIDRDPHQAMGHIGMTLSGLDPERWGKVVANQKAPFEAQKAEAEAFTSRQEALAAPERVEQERRKAEADIKNVESQITERSDRLAFDKDKALSEYQAKLAELNQKQGQLDEGARKLVNESVVNAVTADQAAGSMLDLAGRLEKEGGGYGVASTAGEWLKRATGSQNAMSDIRKEYIRLRNTQAIKMLPPGVATDRDVAMALEGFPDPSADAGTISSFLRGMAKMNQVAAVGENAKSEWVNAVGHLGKPKTDIVIDGVSVPAGTTFADFSRGYIAQKAQQRGVEQAQQQVPQRSYMKYANPGAQ